MKATPAIVVTTINNARIPALQALSKGAQKQGWRLIVIGDKKTPEHFYLDGAEFHNIESQMASDRTFSSALPYHNYARKNIGYLYAIQEGASCIIDTDDDNIPYQNFWNERCENVAGLIVSSSGWFNAYSLFTTSKVWPRGFPLDEIQQGKLYRGNLITKVCCCPIQQGLTDGDPDVDAIYRLTRRLPIKFKFKKHEPIILKNGSICPINSQNTTFFPNAYPLLYLPSYCSFRMADIWRGLVAIHIAKANGWGISFAASTGYQERNYHNLIQDFKDEIPGYLNNKKICKALDSINIIPGVDKIYENLIKAYDELVKIGVIQGDEM